MIVGSVLNLTVLVGPRYRLLLSSLGQVRWLRVPPTLIVPLSASERQSGWV
jgi:hypothetical protein